ncbi:MAG: alkaline phosphatase family protein [Chloroflexota bacterium]
MGKAFEHVMIVMLENASREMALKNDYLNTLRKKGVLLSNSYGVAHPSKLNYIAIIAGDLFGINHDSVEWAQVIGDFAPDPPPITTIVDLLEAQGYSWKAYVEELEDSDKPVTNLTKPPYPKPPPDHDMYARKHVPFLSFPSITNNADRMACIVNADELEKDLAAGTFPHYSMYIPSLVNDGHNLATDTKRFSPYASDRHLNIENIATFLQNLLGDDPLTKFPPETLLVITFDEAYPYHAGYGIYTLLIGDMLESGTTQTEAHNHYSTLRSIEENFGMGTLHRNDATARPWWFLRT